MKPSVPFGLSQNENAFRISPAATALTALVVAQGLASVAHAEPMRDSLESMDAVALDRFTVDATHGTPVSSPKFTEPVKDIPATIDVIPQAVYTQQGATTLSDVLRNTPGITFFAGEGGSANRTGGDSFYLRGFDTSNSIYIDGVRDEGAVTRDTFNIEQVEVVKGPSAENGRGGTAGYVNLVSKVPQEGAFEAATLSYAFDEHGANGNLRATADINQSLGDSVVKGAAFRLNLMDQGGGVAGRDITEKNRWSVAPSLALGLGTSTRVFLSYQHTRENNTPDYGLPSTIVDGSAPAAYEYLYAPGVDPHNYYGFANFDREHITNDNITARVEHDFSAQLKINNQTRYSATDRWVEATSPSSNATTPQGQVTLAQGIYQTRNTILSNQTNLRADIETGAVAHTITAGLELSRETADNPIWAVVPNGVANPSYLTSIYSPNTNPESLLNYTPHKTGSDTDTKIDTEALYAFDTAKIGSKWELTGGVRLEHYDIDETSVTVATPAIAATAAKPATSMTPATASTAAVAAVPFSSIELRAKKTVPAWRAGLIYKLTPNGSLYGSVSTAERPPGTSGYTNTLSTTTTAADNPLLAPQKATNYEIGTKWEFFDERLLATAAVFRSVNSHVPTADPITGLPDQTSDQTVQGVELNASGKITDNWLVLGGMAFMHSEVSALISTNAQGLTLPLLPKQSGNLWTTYRLPFGVTIGGGTQYMGATKRLQATNAPIATTFSSSVDAYWVFSALASYEITKNMTIRLNVNNLFDREYVASLNNNGYRLNLGTPRSYLLSIDLKF
jgi:catecholate siderophore receptor